MSESYRILDPTMPYFVTFSVINWIPVFQIDEIAIIISDALNFCSKEKGLEIFAYCIMPSHVHLIIRAIPSGPGPIIRDIKKFTAVKIVQTLHTNRENKWRIKSFTNVALSSDKNMKIRVWQDGYHPEMIYSNKFFYQKLNYIHMNPVKAGLSELPEQYFYSSARNYASLDAPVEVILQSPELLTY